MAHSLSERQERYELDYDYTILNRVPVIIRITIRNYKKLIQQLDAPFCSDFYDIMSQTMLFTITSIPDAVLGYYHNDEITFVLKNDHDYDSVPWHGNNIQKIVSTVASLVTLGYYKSVDLFNDNLDLGEAIFSVKAFAVPSIIESFNNLIWRQGICVKNAINNASLSELTDKLGSASAASLLKNKDYNEKTELLLQHCGKNIRDDYPIPFLRGVGVYKIPIIVSTRNGSANRNRWYVDRELPNFVEGKDFILNILNTGLDIYRGPDVLLDKEKDEY
ncbi:MAG: tRNA(His) guanylyltransferase Thg1 family protein [bacterium]|nr:tRNA(His) guanylyltransferase Thg1 family protein [bacterium]